MSFVMKWTKKLPKKSFTRKLYDDNYEKGTETFFPNSTYTENKWQNAVEEIKKICSRDHLNAKLN